MEGVSDVINRFALPLFLFQTTAWPCTRDQLRDLRQHRPTAPDLLWWLTRPLAFIGPLLCTLPVIYLFGRRWVTRQPSFVPTKVQSAS